MWKWVWGEMMGLRRFRHDCERQLFAHAGLAAALGPLWLQALLQPFARYGLDVSQPPGHPLCRRKKLWWGRWGWCRWRHALKELAWLLQFPLPCFFF